MSSYTDFAHTDEKLGSGGMGDVYLVIQLPLNREVAAKFSRKAHDQQRLRREAEIMAMLDHPYIVPVYALGRDKEGRLFYAMKKLKDRRWSAEIGQRKNEFDLEVLLKIADALAYAHTNGVYHLDLKPENVFLGDHGEVYLSDWGIAITKDDEPRDAERGTPQYVSPECAAGKFEQIGSHSDIYLLGAVLYRILTGQPPRVGGRGYAAFFEAAWCNQIRPTECRGELMDIAFKAMKTDPNDRYQSVGEFQESIRAYQSHAESDCLARKAEQSFQRARELGAYRDFQEAYFTFDAAYKLWNGNQYAQERIVAVRLAYARTALENGDLEHAKSELEGESDRYTELQKKIDDAIVARNEQEQRLKIREKQLGIARRQRSRFSKLAFIAVVVGLLVAIILQYEIDSRPSESSKSAAGAVEARNRPDSGIDIPKHRTASNAAPFRQSLRYGGPFSVQWGTTTSFNR